MCQKFVLASTLERIESRFNVQLGKHTLGIPSSYFVSDGDYSYVITGADPSAIQTFKFGMTPFYSSGPMSLLNARAEGDKNGKNDPNYTGSKSIFLQTAFKKPIQFQRCLILADAYYEWSSRNKPYLIYLQNKNRPFAFAGIYDRWQDPESKEIVFSFAIITTVANSLLQSIGIKRMPVILSRSGEAAWIKSSNHLSDVLRLLTPYPSEKMNGYPVSELVNMPGVNDPSLLNPAGERLLIESRTEKVIAAPHYKKEPESDEPWFKKNSNIADSNG